MYEFGSRTMEEEHIYIYNACQYITILTIMGDWYKEENVISSI